MRFSVVNIGCKVNRVEVDAAAAELLGQGAEMAPPGEPADIVVVNTCTVTGEADKKTRKAVRQALRANPDAHLLVTGCAAVMSPEWFGGLGPRVHVVPKPQIAARAWECVRGRGAGALPPSCRESPGAVSAAGATAPRIGAGFRTRVGIKAQDGCDNACSFCIVHVARGASRSVPLERVVAEARAHAGAGVRELVLTGINLGAYDDGGRDLADLLEALLGACPASRIRVGSVEPRDVSGRLVEVMAASDGRVCRHLHLPLQSGSSRVLSEMNRPYDAPAFLELVGGMRAAMPGLSLSTDIIVGFPGESEGDFDETMEAAREAAFSKIHVFRYSRRDGTPAAARVDQVDPPTAAGRARRLQELGARLRLEDALRRVGTSELVLVEREGRGISESYHPVRWTAAGASGRGAAVPAAGELTRVPLTEVSGDGIFLA